MEDDPQLLRRYVETRLEEAFTELVRRHIGLVYSCALRRVGQDAHLAEDVTQQVFTDLARKAPSLLERPSLAGWLYVSTQHAAAALVRQERRRKIRETQATLMENILNSPTPATPDDWSRLRPLLDELILDLKDIDREAVVLRFFERRPFAEIAAALSLTEDGARKRVERAVEKLRGQLAERGVTSGAAALAIALAEPVGAAVPAALAGNVAGAALAELAVVGTGASVLAWLGAALTSGTAAVIFTILVGGGFMAWQHHANSERAVALANAGTGQGAMIQSLERENLRLARRVAEAADLSKAQAAAPVTPSSTPAPMQRDGPLATLTVTEKGAMMWEGERITLEDLLHRLQALQADPTIRARVSVNGLPGAGFGATSYVIEQASKAGIKDIAVAAPALPTAPDNWITVAAADPGPADKAPPTIPDRVVRP